MGDVYPIVRPELSSFDEFWRATKAHKPIFYVYVLKRPDGTPFYVGKGHNSRIEMHEWKARKGYPGYLCNTIRSIWATGGEVVKDKVATGLVNDAAIELERQLIAKYGRFVDGGILCNLTTGGEGAAGYKHTPETIAKLKRAWKTRPPISAEVRRKMSANRKGKKASEASRLKLSRSISGERHWNFGRQISAEHAERLHKSTRKRVVVSGVEYKSIAAAASVLGIKPHSLTYRINCGNYPECRYA